MSAATQRIASGSEYESRYGFSRAVRDGRRVVVSGTAPIRPDWKVEIEAEAQLPG